MTPEQRAALPPREAAPPERDEPTKQIESESHQFTTAEIDLLAIPQWVQDEIGNPKEPGEGCNDQAIKIGPTLLRCGVTPARLEEIFGKMLPQAPEEEIERLVRNSARYANTPLNETEKADVQRRREIRDDARRALRLILREPRREPPTPPKRRLQEQRRLFLTTLFEPDDVLWIGDLHYKRFLPLACWLKMRKIPGRFVCPSTFKLDSRSRCNSNVTRRKYLVVESDKLKPNEVTLVFKELEHHHRLRLRALVSSGGKSIHSWFDWPKGADPKDLKALVEGYECDPKTLTPSQPVRCPGALRPDTGKPQELLFIK